MSGGEKFEAQLGCLILKREKLQINKYVVDQT
jgi:hypothetical protein